MTTPTIAASRPMDPAVLDALIDPMTGVIRTVSPTALPAHFPAAARQFTTELADTTQFTSWAADTAGAGTTFLDEDAAVAAAVGEAIERYCANLVPGTLRTASYEELRRVGEAALDPRTLALYSPAQYATPGFPFVPFDEHLTVEWVRGRHLLTDRPVWIPAPLVWITYFETEATRNTAPTNALVHAGVAAGSGRAHAEWSALTELVERDAMTLAWNGRRPVYLIEPPAWISGMIDSDRLHARFLLFPSDFGLPALGAVMIDQETGYTCMGTACRTDLDQAMLKATAEALQMQLIIRKMDDPEGPFAQIATTATSPMKPWRRDRRYLDDYRTDYRDFTHHACHLQAYMDRRMRELLERELADLETIPLAQDGSLRSHEDLIRPASGSTDAAKLRSLAQRIDDAGHPVYSVDLTTADIRPTGINVSRVIAPGLYSYAAAAFPCLGGARLTGLLTDPDRQARRLPLPH